jgi:hypothetical protein
MNRATMAADSAVGPMDVAGADLAAGLEVVAATGCT